MSACVPFAAESAGAEPRPDEDLSGGRWPASLRLRLGETTRGVGLTEQLHHGPLYVQKPFYPEGRRCPHIYLLHPPGGLVSGDRLDIDIAIDRGCSALFTTPGAGRIYRARADGRRQRQHVRITVAAEACVEWLPGENLLYPQANACSRVQIDLAAGGRFAGWDITSVGLPASALAFTQGRVAQHFEIVRAGRPLFIDHLHLDAAQTALLGGSAGLQGKSVSALLVAGPLDAGSLDPLVARLRQQAPGDALLGVSAVGELLVVRYLGDCAWRARQCLIACWACIRPALLQRCACPPRIWTT